VARCLTTLSSEDLPINCALGDPTSLLINLMHVAWRDDRSLSGRGRPWSGDFVGVPRSHRPESVTESAFSGSYARRSCLRRKKKKWIYPTPRSLSRPDGPSRASTILCSTPPGHRHFYDLTPKYGTGETVHIQPIWGAMHIVCTHSAFSIQHSAFRLCIHA
jgi:hypothetical protein